MSTNCLVTKLKSVVNNDSLKTFGAFKISLDGTSSLKLKVQSTKVQNVKVLEGFVTIYGQSVSEFTVPANTLYNIYSDVSSKIVLLFSDKYSIATLEVMYSITGFNLEDLEYSDNFTSISCIKSNPDIIGDISSLKNLNLIETFDIRNSNLTGDISVFSGLTNLITLTIPENKRIYGDIESFGNLTSLSTVKIGGSVLVSGTLESLVAGQVSNGRTSGSITMGYLCLSNVTFNGVKPDDNSVVTLTWEPNSTDNTKTDVSYNGVTITIDANGNKVE